LKIRAAFSLGANFHSFAGRARPSGAPSGAVLLSPLHPEPLKDNYHDLIPGDVHSADDLDDLLTTISHQEAAVKEF
jgi:hypothetical protein